MYRAVRTLASATAKSSGSRVSSNQLGETRQAEGKIRFMNAAPECNQQKKRFQVQTRSLS
jgi:hypothetical protein